MAIVQTGSTLTFTGMSAANSGTVSSTITVPADAEYVLSGWSGYSSSTTFFSTGGMTFTKGGSDTAMTYLGGQNSGNGWSGPLFGLVLPDTGSNMSLKFDWAGTSAAGDSGSLCTVTFWKGVDTTSPVRSSGTGSSVSNTPYTTGSLAGSSGDLAVAWAGAFCSAEGTAASWSNLTLLTQITRNTSADGAWATGSPTGSSTYAVSTDTNWDDGAIAVVVLKPAAGGGGDQSLTPSLFTDADTFFAPTVTRGAVTLTPGLFSDADTFFAPTALATYSLAPSLFSDGDSFFAPTVAPGAVTLAPGLYSDADTFFAATVSPGAVTLTPSLYSDADTFFAPTVSANYTLTPALFSDGDTFYSATVAPGAVTLTPSLFTDADTFYSATVSQGDVLLPTLFVDADTFYSATVAPGAVTLTPALFSDGDTFYSVSASYGLTPSIYTDADTFYGPSVSASYGLTPDLFVDGDSFYPPTVTTIGDATLLPSLFVDGDTFYQATLVSGSTLDGSGVGRKSTPIDKLYRPYIFDKPKAVKAAERANFGEIDVLPKRLKSFAELKALLPTVIEQPFDDEEESAALLLLED